MKKLLLYLIFPYFVFSYTEKNKIDDNLLNFINKNLEYICPLEKENFKIETEKIIGHYDEKGNPYGEWYLKDRSIVECYLENERIKIVEGSYYIKETPEFSLIKILKNGHIQLMLKNIDGKNKYIFISKLKKGKVYEDKAILILETIPLYQQVKKIEESKNNIHE